MKTFKTICVLLALGLCSIAWGQKNNYPRKVVKSCPVYELISDDFKNSLRMLAGKIQEQEAGLDDYFIVLECCNPADSVYCEQNFLGLADFSLSSYTPSYYFWKEERLGKCLTGAFYINGSRFLLFSKVDPRFFRKTKARERIEYEHYNSCCLCVEYEWLFNAADEHNIISYPEFSYRKYRE